jgi:hypothetical protein
MMTKQSGGMLRLFTTQRFTLHTALAPHVAKQRLSQQLESRRILYDAFAWHLDYRLFGFIKGGHFELTKIKRMRNYHTGLEIIGDIHGTPTGSAITIILRPSMGHVIGWLGLIAVGALVSFHFLVAAFTYQISFGLGLFPAGLLLAVLLFRYAIGPENPEMGIIRVQLQDIFEAHTVNDEHSSPSEEQGLREDNLPL